MNVRERFHKTMNFEPVDRLPMVEWACWWDETLDAWKKEGLVMPEPRDGLNAGDVLKRDLGLELMPDLHAELTTAATPQPAYFGGPIVSSLEEYERIKPTLYPEEPFDPEVLKAYAELQQRGEIVFRLVIDGFFWGPRVLLGIEPHLYAFYEEPELMHTINQDIADYNVRVYQQICRYFVPDFVSISEDLSYNKGPMLSEKMFDEFLLPYYQQIIPPMKEKGTRIFIDSDGDVTLALPWFIRADIEGVLPLERQAGVDLKALRKVYPKFLFLGHFNKMIMHKGEAAMREEFERLLPVMRQGGFVPSVDHQTPPSVSLENYKIYLRLLREYTEKVM